MNVKSIETSNYYGDPRAKIVIQNNNTLLPPPPPGQFNRNGNYISMYIEAI